MSPLHRLATVTIFLAQCACTSAEDDPPLPSSDSDGNELGDEQDQDDQVPMSSASGGSTSNNETGIVSDLPDDNHGDSGGEDEGSDPEADWPDMTQEQRVEYMVSTVLPAMEELFGSFDGGNFADFTCDTCHGSGAATFTFVMPSGDLPELSSDLSVERAQNPSAVAFMEERVVPQMAALFKLPADSEGIDCWSCHTPSGD